MSQQNKYGDIALHYAAYWDGALEVVKWLVENGADVTAKRNHRMNALECKGMALL